MASIEWPPKQTYIVGELSANHNQDMNRAKETIEAIAQAGADAVKVQTYRPESLCLNIDNAHFGKRHSGPWKGMTMWEIYEKGSLPYEWHCELKELANRLNLDFFSSPFDLQGVDFLEELEVPLYKIASFEITHHPLIRKVAKLGKPIIFSTGVAEPEDIKMALDICYQEANQNLALLKCTSEYPAQLSDANLNTMLDLKARFGSIIGLSDHTLGSTVATTAVAMGASIIEKHFTLSRAEGGLDSAFSMEPHEFKDMVDQIRLIEQCKGGIDYQVSDKNKLRRRSLFFTTNLSAGERLAEHDLAILRGGSGMHPKNYDMLLGKRICQSVEAGTPVLENQFNQPGD